MDPQTSTLVEHDYSTSQEAISRIPLEMVATNYPEFSFQGYEDHLYRLILSYPLNQEFLSSEELKQKVAEFHEAVLRPEQYALLFRVNSLAVGEHSSQYLLSFTGTVSGDYLETDPTEVVSLLIAQLEGFFTCVQAGQFAPLYFELDGQAVIEPTKETVGVPEGYTFDRSFASFADSLDIWDLYIAQELFYLLAEVSVEAVDAIAGGIEGLGANGAAGVAEAASSAPVPGGGVIDALKEGAENSPEAAAVAAEAAALEAGSLAEGAAEGAEGLVDGVAEGAEVVAEVAGEAAELAGGALEAGAELAGGLLEFIFGLFGN